VRFDERSKRRPEIEDEAGLEIDDREDLEAVEGELLEDVAFVVREPESKERDGGDVDRCGEGPGRRAPGASSGSTSTTRAPAP
jgi:hypothetical protein